MGKTWHPEHFVCTHCQEEIGSRNFFERDGQPYCEKDYHNLFSPRCFYCNGAILDVRAAPPSAGPGEARGHPTPPRPLRVPVPWLPLQGSASSVGPPVPPSGVLTGVGTVVWYPGGCTWL